MTLRISKVRILIIFALVIVFSALFGDESFTIGFITKQAASQIAQTQVGQTSPRINSLVVMDLLRAIQHTRPNQWQSEGINAIQNISIAEVRALAGFVFEQRYARLKSTKDVKYTVYSAGDEVVDVLETNVRTGKQARLQLYAGNNARKAIEKLLVSDKAADRLVLPSDTYDSIMKTLHKATEVWKKYQAGTMTMAKAVHELRQLLGPLGFHVDDRGQIFFGSGRGYAIALGTADAKSFLRNFDNLERWHETSDTIFRKTAQALFRVKPSYLWLLADLSEQYGGESDAVTRILQEISSNSENMGFRAMDEAGQKHERRASKWGESREASLRLARLYGIGEEEVHAIYRDRAKPSATGIRSVERERNILFLQRVLYKPYAMGAVGVAGSTALGGAYEWILSDKEIGEWLGSQEGKAWMGRLIGGEISMLAAFAVEKALWDHTSTVSPNRLMLRSLAGFGTGSIVYAFGEGLVLTIIYGQTWPAMISEIGEQLLISAIAAGASWSLVYTGAISGGWVGPVGIVIGVSFSILRNIQNYLWSIKAETAIEHGTWDGMVERARRAVFEEKH